MSLSGKLVSEIEINESAEKYYKFFKEQFSHARKVCSTIVNHEGDCHKVITIWKYNVDGKPESLKEQVEFHDEELKVTIIGLEGDAFDRYKILDSTYICVPKDPKHSFIDMTLEYEKLNDGIPNPDKYLDPMIKALKDIESRLISYV